MFIVGKTYQFRSICDHDCIWSLTVLKVTPKTILAKVSGEQGEKRLKIHEYNREMFVYPFGQYSMSPTCRA
jgi:hypothetical protein